MKIDVFVLRMFLTGQLVQLVVCLGLLWGVRKSILRSGTFFH